jgi:hypothetical protein
VSTQGDETTQHPAGALLFVHGIGSQRAGDTLAQFSESLLGFLGEHGTGLTVIPTAEGDTAATTRREYRVIYTDEHGRPQERLVLLAEAHWADVFRHPNRIALVCWLLQVMSGFMMFHLGATFFGRVLDAAVDLRRAVAARRKGAAAGAALRFARVAVAGQLAAVSRYVMVAVAGVLLFLVLPLSLLPPVHRCLKRLFDDTVGDSYVAVTNPAQFRRITSTVKRAVDECLGACGPAGRVTVVAHSQGAMISQSVLAARRYGDRVTLVGLGSGLGPLHALRSRLDQTRLSLALGAMIVMEVFLAAALGVSSWPFLVALGSFPRLVASAGEGARSGSPTQAREVMTAAASPLRDVWAAQDRAFVLIGVACAAGLLMARLGRRGGLTALIDGWTRSLAMPAGAVREWVEYSSRYDPVSCGPLLATTASRTYDIVNGPWLLAEHTRYWKNPLVLLELATQLGEALEARLIPADRVREVTAEAERVARRHRLVLGATVLAGWLFATAALAVSFLWWSGVVNRWLGLPPDRIF